MSFASPLSTPTLPPPTLRSTTIPIAPTLSYTSTPLLTHHRRNRSTNVNGDKNMSARVAPGRRISSHRMSEMKKRSQETDYHQRINFHQQSQSHNNPNSLSPWNDSAHSQSSSSTIGTRGATLTHSTKNVESSPSHASLIASQPASSAHHQPSHHMAPTMRNSRAAPNGVGGRLNGIAVSSSSSTSTTIDPHSFLQLQATVDHLTKQLSHSRLSSSSSPPFTSSSVYGLPSSSFLSTWSPTSCPPEAHLAATLIQSAWRGLICRRRVREEYDNELREKKKLKHIEERMNDFIQEATKMMQQQRQPQQSKHPSLSSLPEPSQPSIPTSPLQSSSSPSSISHTPHPFISPVFDPSSSSSSSCEVSFLRRELRLTHKLLLDLTRKQSQQDEALRVLWEEVKNLRLATTILQQQSVTRQQQEQEEEEEKQKEKEKEKAHRMTKEERSQSNPSATAKFGTQGLSHDTGDSAGNLTPSDPTLTLSSISSSPHMQSSHSDSHLHRGRHSSLPDPNFQSDSDSNSSSAPGLGVFLSTLTSTELADLVRIQLKQAMMESVNLRQEGSSLNTNQRFDQIRPLSNPMAHPLLSPASSSSSSSSSSSTMPPSLSRVFSMPLMNSSDATSPLSPFHSPHRRVMHGHVNLTRRGETQLKRWIRSHISHPYPTMSEKLALAQKTGLTYTQVEHWMIDARMAILATPEAFHQIEENPDENENEDEDEDEEVKEAREGDQSDGNAPSSVAHASTPFHQLPLSSMHVSTGSSEQSNDRDEILRPTRSANEAKAKTSPVDDDDEKKKLSAVVPLVTEQSYLSPIAASSISHPSSKPSESGEMTQQAKQRQTQASANVEVEQANQLDQNQDADRDQDVEDGDVSGDDDGDEDNDSITDSSLALDTDTSITVYSPSISHNTLSTRRPSQSRSRSNTHDRDDGPHDDTAMQPHSPRRSSHRLSWVEDPTLAEKSTNRYEYSSAEEEDEEDDNHRVEAIDTHDQVFPAPFSSLTTLADPISSSSTLTLTSLAAMSLDTSSDTLLVDDGDVSSKLASVGSSHSRPLVDASLDLGSIARSVWRTTSDEPHCDIQLAPTTIAREYRDETDVPPSSLPPCISPSAIPIDHDNHTQHSDNTDAPAVPLGESSRDTDGIHSSIQLIDIGHHEITHTDGNNDPTSDNRLEHISGGRASLSAKDSRLSLSAPPPIGPTEQDVVGTAAGELQSMGITGGDSLSVAIPIQPSLMNAAHTDSTSRPHAHPTGIDESTQFNVPLSESTALVVHVADEQTNVGDDALSNANIDLPPNSSQAILATHPQDHDAHHQTSTMTSDADPTQPNANYTEESFLPSSFQSATKLDDSIYESRIHPLIVHDRVTRISHANVSSAHNHATVSILDPTATDDDPTSITLGDDAHGRNAHTRTATQDGDRAKDEILNRASGQPTHTMHTTSTEPLLSPPVSGAPSTLPPSPQSQSPSLMIGDNPPSSNESAPVPVPVLPPPIAPTPPRSPQSLPMAPPSPISSTTGSNFSLAIDLSMPPSPTSMSYRSISAGGMVEESLPSTPVSVNRSIAPAHPATAAVTASSSHSIDSSQSPVLTDFSAELMPTAVDASLLALPPPTPLELESSLPPTPAPGTPEPEPQTELAPSEDEHEPEVSETTKKNFTSIIQKEVIEAEPMKFSKLIVDILQARNLSMIPSSSSSNPSPSFSSSNPSLMISPNPYAVLLFQSSRGETESCESTTQPAWATSFCFDVEKELLKQQLIAADGHLIDDDEPLDDDFDHDITNDHLAVTICSRDMSSESLALDATRTDTDASSGEDPLLGTVVLPIDELASQLLDTSWHPLFGRLAATGERVTGEVQLARIWIHDLKEMVNQYDRCQEDHQRRDYVEMLYQIDMNKLMVKSSTLQLFPFSSSTVLPPNPLRGLRLTFFFQDQAFSTHELAQTDQAHHHTHAVIDSPSSSIMPISLPSSFTWDVDDDIPDLSLRIQLHCLASNNSADSDVDDSLRSHHELIGITALNCSMLEDQQTRTLTCQLKHPQTAVAVGSVTLSILWLHDLTEFVLQRSQHNLNQPNK